jgi:hypothetical protein
MRVSARILAQADILSMLRAVHFDNHFVFEADEVEHVTIDRRLTAEVEPLRPQSAQMDPEFNLLRRHVLAQRSGAGNGHGLYAASSL